MFGIFASRHMGDACTAESRRKYRYRGRAPSSVRAPPGSRELCVSGAPDGFGNCCPRPGPKLAGLHQLIRSPKSLLFPRCRAFSSLSKEEADIAFVLASPPRCRLRMHEADGFDSRLSAKAEHGTLGGVKSPRTSRRARFSQATNRTI